MAISNILATSNALKLGSVGSISSFYGKPNHYLAHPLSLATTLRVQSSCSYRETSLKAVTSLVMPEAESSDGDGIGILRFLRGKSYLVTGATGFLAKVLIEKLLRASPEIGKIFLLMRSKDQQSANKRLYDEIISSDLFELLKQKHGNSSYEAFMKSKLIPVIGDIGEDNLGFESEIAERISEEIDVIISCGGRTTFDDRYDSALSVNVLGPSRLLSFAKKCKKLQLFLHYSTAYASGQTEGKIKEKPLFIGENITSDLNIEYELKLASEAVGKFPGSEGNKKLKELGLERAQRYGWENTYTFTKAMGESVIHGNRGDLPVVIIRPSIVESSYKEPFPGWIQGIRMLDPIIVAYGKGQISGFWADSQSLLYVIPVDMVVNATIAAMAKHGCGVSELKVYNVTSSSHANPLRFGQLMDLCYQHLCDSPLTDTKIDIERINCHSSFETFTTSVSNIITKQKEESHTTLSKKEKRKLNYFESLARIYEPYMFFQARSDDTNTISLIQELSMEERKMFDFDFRGIDWEHYIVNVHLPGLKRQFFQRKSS